MAAGVLPASGTEYGPCAEPCEHEDCALTRAMAERDCVFCGKPIGYGTRFYKHTTGRPWGLVENRGQDPNGLVHAVCLEATVP